MDVLREGRVGMRLRWTIYRPTDRAQGRSMAALLVVAFVVLAVVTRVACRDPNGNTVFWPANSAMVVALMILPARLSVPTLAICFVLNVGLDLVTHYTVFDTLLYCVLNVGVSVLVAFLTRNLCGAATDLSRVRRLATFGAIAFLGAAVEATVGDVIEPGGSVKVQVLNDWLQWTLCDGFGFLITTPALLLSLGSSRDAYPCDAGRLERWGLLLGAAILTAASFRFTASPSFMLIYPLLVLTAFRAGAPWVLASILLTSIISCSLTTHGFGPLADRTESDLLLGQGMLQPFLVSIFLCAIPANNALGEKGRNAHRLLRMKDAVTYAATHDTLTTLANRDLFRGRLGALLRNSVDCAVLFIDLDRFKQINDTMGHGAGDQLLRGFSTRMLAITGPEVMVARFGGDEFAMLMPCGPTSRGVAQPDPEALCRTIIEAARTPFPLSSGPTQVQVQVSASIGLAIGRAQSYDAGELMRRADIALYAAKAGGRDGYRVFCDELDRSSRDRARLRADLEAALALSGQLRLHYQAKVDAGGRPRGVEALLRWQHPSRGPVPVNQLISIAEETGIIVPLGAWVLREALGFAARWPALDIAVNVSPVQLRHPRFVEDTLQALHASTVPPGRIELEITETSLMDDLDSINGKLATLRAAGLRIALDDFGTGCSSLRHLHRCSVDRVKIDQSFVAALGDTAEAAAIIRAVIELGHAMGLQVTAEGVETEAQRHFLVATGIDEMQGYLFAQPVAESALDVGLRRPRRPAPLIDALMRQP